MVLKSLENILEAKAILTETDRLGDYGVDGLTPEAVVFPGTMEEAAEVVKLANQDGFSIAVAGGGTKASIGGLLKRADVVLSTKRLDKIIDIDTANLTVTSQAGVPFDDVQDLLTGMENRCFFPLDGELEETANYMCSDREYKGAFIPLDPPLTSRATMGGIVAANSMGPQRLRYRPLRDSLLGVRFVSPAGAVIGMGGKTVKNVSGYDVSKLMIGSQGCLGVMGEMTFRLLPLPEKTAALIVSFTEAEKAESFVKTVLDSKLLPTAVQVLNKTAFDLSALTGIEAPRGGLIAAVGQAGLNEEQVRERDDLIKEAQKAGALETIELRTDEAAGFWRRLGDNSLKKAVVKFKVNYLISGFSEFLSEAARSGDDWAFSVSAGCGISNVCYFGRDLEEAARNGEKLRAMAGELKGALAVEAAPPEFKKNFDIWGGFGGAFDMMKRIKTELDPNGILNPGRFVGGV